MYSYTVTFFRYQRYKKQKSYSVNNNLLLLGVVRNIVPTVDLYPLR